MNPFQLTGYHGPELFCDREEETEKLYNAIDNECNITLTSVRKMGKSGLIKHVLHQLKANKKAYSVYYLDIYHTENLSNFLEVFGKELMNNHSNFPQKVRNLFENFIKSLNPTISFDPLSGKQNLSFNFNSNANKEQSIIGIFDILSKISTTKKVVIAIDEFQQIAKYPEKNVEALLRGVIQNLKNINFIFSGSDTSIMTEIFNDSKRPFYQSTQLMHLSHIPYEKYSEFINHHFQSNKRQIDKEAVDFILDETRIHTYYVQFLCNRAFASKKKKINLNDIKLLYSEILQENEAYYSTYKDMLSTQQWKLLIALAKEGGFASVTSGDFIRNYNLSNASTIRRSVKSLLQKQMIFKKDNSYYVYDVFFARWLTRL